MEEVEIMSIAAVAFERWLDYETGRGVFEPLSDAQRIDTKLSFLDEVTRRIDEHLQRKATTT